MSIKEYADSMNCTVQEILNKCRELGIKASDKDSFLEDDDIIVLDNAINIISTNTESTFEDNDALDEAVENILGEEINSKPIIKKEKLKKKGNNFSSKDNDYLNKKKAMYKNKTKLKGNDASNDSIILYEEGETVSSLANKLGVSAPDIIKKLISLGLMMNLNQVISFENAEIVVLDYGKTLKKSETRDISNFEEYEVIDDEADLVLRPPVITVMGHVDHGKTTLLDYIRKSHVAAGEAGGITQAIGAYQIDYNGSKITFIDTPGHAAFTAMRARGASVTDIVIIVVAADDGVMPQTKEAVEHAISAGVPIVVAVNKMDKPSANPDKIMQEMAELNLTPEAWGGNIPFVNISAVTGAGIDKLLDTVLAIAEVSELKANPNRYAIGTVIETRADKALGSVASILIQNGTLRLGDPIVAGTVYGRIRTLKNDQGVNIISAGPSTPVEITGLNGSPAAGDKFMAFESEKEAKEIAEKREIEAKNQKQKKEVVSFDDLFNKIKGGAKEIKVVLKCDVRGSEEAVKNALEKLSTDEVKIKVIRSGIGGITESDVILANASDAVVIGFNVVPSNITKDVAKEYGVEIRLYQIIYKLVEEMELAMKGMLDPEYEEKVLGTASIKRMFKFSKVGSIAGCIVTSGIIKNKAQVRVIRDGVIIYDGIIASLQREKDTVKEVKNGLECGITIENFNDLKEGDIFEVYENVEVKR
ncbi:MAG: translation initiation factor IF-2 [Clostridiaceae bacterium]|nr:MAG: translation initiation factor IF-2 [Clostridiaceae bacterium]